MKRRAFSSLCLETLEDRLVPTFNVFFSSYTSTMMITQVADNGPATIAVDGANNLVLTDGSGSVTIGPAGANLSITMLSGSGNLDVDLDTGLTGGVTLNLGNGDRTVNFTGSANSMNGNLRITAGSGDQTFNLGTAADMNVGGSANIDLGLGFDSVTLTILHAGKNV